MSRLVKNSIIYSIGNAITALSTFLLLPIYTKYLTVADFGITNSMQTLSGILVIVLSLALERSVLRIYYDYFSEKDQKDFLGTVFISLVLFGTLGTITCFLANSLLNRLFPEIQFNPFYKLTILYSLALSIINFSQIIAQVRQNANQFILISLLSCFLTIGINIFLIAELKEGALGYVRGMLYGVLLVFPLALYYVHRSINYTFSFVKLKNALAFSFPMFPSLLSAWVLNLSDRVFIDNYYTHADVGVYSLAYKISSIVTFASTAIFMAYNPLFYSIANQNEISLEERKNKIYNINSGMILIIGIIGVIVLCSSDLVVKLFFSKAYSNAYSYISVFTLSFIIAQICGLLNLMAYQSKRTTIVAAIITLSAIVNVGLNYLLIPRYGVYYAAITTLICTAINFILMYFLARKSFFIRIEWRMILIIFSSYIVVYVENLVLKDEPLSVLIFAKLVSVFILLFIFKDPIFKLFAKLKRKQLIQ